MRCSQIPALVLIAVLLQGLLVPSVTWSAEQKSITVPDGWVETFRQANEGMSMVEYVPDGQNFKNWSEMMTVVRTRARNSKIVRSLLQIPIAAIAKRCRADPLVRSRYRDQQDRQQGIIAEVACDDVDTSNTPPGVVAFRKELLRVYAGEVGSGVLSLQLAWHDAELSARSKFGDTTHQAFFEARILDARKQFAR